MWHSCSLNPPRALLSRNPAVILCLIYGLTPFLEVSRSEKRVLCFHVENLWSDLFLVKLFDVINVIQPQQILEAEMELSFNFSRFPGKPMRKLKNFRTSVICFGGNVWSFLFCVILLDMGFEVSMNWSMSDNFIIIICSRNSTEKKLQHPRDYMIEISVLSSSIFVWKIQIKFLPSSNLKGKGIFPPGVFLSIFGRMKSAMQTFCSNPIFLVWLMSLFPCISEQKSTLYDFYQ